MAPEFAIFPHINLGLSEGITATENIIQSFVLLPAHRGYLAVCMMHKALFIEITTLGLTVYLALLEPTPSTVLCIVVHLPRVVFCLV